MGADDYITKPFHLAELNSRIKSLARRRHFEEANEWEAEFNLNGKKMSACFDNSAVWIDSETEISEKELPAAVINTLSKDFQGYKKSLIEIYESPEIKGFELTLKKGESSLEVVFDNSGKAIKKTEAKEEAEKNEKAGKVKN